MSSADCRVREVGEVGHVVYDRRRGRSVGDQQYRKTAAEQHEAHRQPRETVHDAPEAARHQVNDESQAEPAPRERRSRHRRVLDHPGAGRHRHMVSRLRH